MKTSKTIKEIEQILSTIDCEDDKFISECREDNRKGVRQLVERWEKKIQEQKNLKQMLEKMSTYERNLREKGFRYIAGVDEVGRGPLAGPVVAAAVILPEDISLLGINDSKKLTEKKRDELFEQINEHAIAIGIGIISAKKIDEVNIYQATKQAMKKAVQQLAIKPDHLLVDAMEIPNDIKQTAIIKGDSKSISIAASSIIAKVTRDRLMSRLADKFPQYGFDQHMGYGTALHIEAINNYGVTEEHRLSFSPVGAVANRSNKHG